MGRGHNSRMRPPLPPRLARKQLQMVIDETIDDAGLTVKEENVLRMKYGLPVADDHPLEFRGQDFPATARQLAEIEKNALAHSQH